MLQWFLNRAQRSVDDVVGSYLLRIAAAVPFLVAAGFAIASFTVEVTRIYGTAGGYLVIALLFGLVGIWAVAALAANGQRTVPERLPGNDTIASAVEQPVHPLLTEANRELLLAIAGTAAPALVPVIRAAITRHWPLVLLLAALLVLWLTADRSPPRHRDAST